jgi:hypothetical protein
MCRDKKPVGLADRKRPSVPRLGHDIDTLGGRSHAMPSEQVGQGHAPPVLLRPPASGAVEDGIALRERHGEQVVVRDRAGRGDLSIDLHAPARNLDRRRGIKCPDREREVISAEGGRSARPR